MGIPIHMAFPFVNIDNTHKRVILSYALKEKCIAYSARREFLRDILYNNIAIIAIHHSKIYFLDPFGNFSHTVE